MVDVTRGKQGAAFRRRATVPIIAVSAMLAAGAAVLVPTGPPAAAGDLEDERDRVEQRLGEARDELNQSTEQLNEATEAYEQAEAELPSAKQALERAEAELATAEEELARAEGEVAAAKAEHARAAERLAEAERRVREQHDEIDAMSREIEGQEADMARLASAAYRRGGVGRLQEVATVMSAPNLKELTSTVGYTRAIMNSDEVELTEMQTSRVELANERVRLDELRDEAERLRTEAAEHLEHTKELEAAARQAADEAAAREAEARAAKKEVEELIRRREEAMAAAENAREEDAQAYEELKAERRRIDEEIEELARRRAERESRDESSGSGGSSGSDTSAAASSSPLAYPVANPYVTSSYGMRVHPITGVRKLHDGTDFRAYCGTAIRAAQDGRVEWAHYRGGYGNQVLVDHGDVHGTDLMSSYSHLSRFAVGPGQRVSQGEVIGYSGTTGYSTACHLHFMVYAGGTRTNPMNHL